MSVENFDVDSLADQPSIIYGYTDDQDELHIKELSRSGYGEPGPSPGDIIDRDLTKSTLGTKLPKLSLPGQTIFQYDCGEAVSEPACPGHDEDSSGGCDKLVSACHSCASPAWERDWSAGVKRNIDRIEGTLNGFYWMLYARYDGRNKNDLPAELLTDSWYTTNDPAKARMNAELPTSYLNTRYIDSGQVQKALRSKRQRSRTTTSWLTWPVTTRCGSRMCGFFCKRNKRLASSQWLRWLLRPVRGATMTMTMQSNARQQSPAGPTPVEPLQE